MRIVLAVLVLLPGLPAGAFDAGRAGFEVQVNGHVIPYSVFAIFALPGESLDIEVLESGMPAEIAAPSVEIQTQAAKRWRMIAPAESGIYPVNVRSGPNSMRLNLFVLVPSEQVTRGYLNGYRIGEYPAEPLGGKAAYLPPRGYIKLTKDYAATRVSPNFTLGQFPAKQAGGYPKYLVLRESLLLKLELLLEEVNRRGIHAPSFVVMSGYRTPFYNAAIGNVPSSRHVFGGAADIYIDTAPRDGVMDDLNGDGRTDVRDAQQLYSWAHALFSRPENRHLFGGMGVYRDNAAHGPFLHMDARGYRARWGMLP